MDRLDREEILRGSEMQARMKLVGRVNDLVDALGIMLDVSRSKPLMQVYTEYDKMKDHIDRLRVRVRALEVKLAEKKAADKNCPGFERSRRDFYAYKPELPDGGHDGVGI